MTFPALAAAVATLAASARKAGLKFSFREKFLLGSVKAYVDAPAPSHVVKFAGSITAAGASATQTLTVTGVAATDIVVVSVSTRAGAGVAYIIRGTPTLNTVTVVGSAAFDNGDLISYVVLRASA